MRTKIPKFGKLDFLASFIIIRAQIFKKFIIFSEFGKIDLIFFNPEIVFQKSDLTNIQISYTQQIVFSYLANFLDHICNKTRQRWEKQFCEASILVNILQEAKLLFDPIFRPRIEKFLYSFFTSASTHYLLCQGINGAYKEAEAYAAQKKCIRQIVPKSKVDTRRNI